MIKLSVLVPTVPSRLDHYYPKLMKCLLEQVKDRQDVEILGFFDNKKRSVGQKRQSLLTIANGEYLVFIDDDDRIAPDYIDQIMTALYANPNADCVVFDCIYTYNGQKHKHCKYGIEFEYWNSPDMREWTGKPAHTMVYRSAIAKAHKYSDLIEKEDVDWVQRACKDIKTQVRINKVLYYYDFNSDISETLVNLKK